MISTLHAKAGQPVCVLVDEYDKPILDALENPELARANRDYLSGLYGMLKSCDEHIRFAFLTGVTTIARASMFSGPNNLRNITLSRAYSDICGYTESDLDTVFAAELPGLDREQIREWYSGYRWGAESVYNPIDLLLLFDKRRFNAWWFETGNPTFLFQLLTEQRVPAHKLEGRWASEALLSTFDVDTIAPEALMFQTGYLTIGERERSDDSIEYFRLVHPNREVRQSLNESLLAYLTGGDLERERHKDALEDLLASGDLVGLEQRIRAFYDSIPYEWHTRNEIARYEWYYSSVFYGYLSGLDVTVTVEDSSNPGRLDMTVQAGGHVYLFECKAWQENRAVAALAQLKERDYAAKYHHLGLPIHLVGVEFSAQKRNVEVFETELA